MSQQLPLTFEQAAALSVDALWGLADEELLRVLVEDRRIERKPVGIRADQLAEYFSMWGNTGPEGGLIAVGISDRGLPLGCLTMEVRHINKLEGEAHNLCPHAHVECKRVPVVRASDAHADFALLFRVHYNDSRVVTTVKGDAFIRRGEYKHRLTAEEIRDLQNDKREVSVEQELCPQYVFPDDFDQSLIDDWATTVRLNLTEPITTERLLVARYLGRLKDGQFVPNAACVLVFATNPRLMFQGAKIQLMRFEGEKEGTGKDWNAVKHAFVEGPIPRMIQAAATFLDSQLREFSKLGPDGRFSARQSTHGKHGTKPLLTLASIDRMDP
jgi:ATP-dependent DNA helicase RecG